MTMSIRDAFERGTDAFNAHDLDAFAETLSDDVVQTAPGGMRFEGKAATMEFFGIWLEAFPDCHVEITRAIVTDDAVVEHGIFSGTHSGAFHTPDGDVPPTGRSVSAEYVNLLSYRDGRFTAGDLLYDRLTLLEQLGLVPQPAAH